MPNEALTLEAVAAREHLDLKDPTQSRRARLIFATEAAGGTPLYGRESQAADACGGADVWQALRLVAERKGIDLQRSFPAACTALFSERADLIGVAAQQGEGEIALAAVAFRERLSTVSPAQREKAIRILMSERPDVYTYGSGKTAGEEESTILLREVQDANFDTALRALASELRLDLNDRDQRKLAFTELARRRPDLAGEWGKK